MPGGGRDQTRKGCSSRYYLGFNWQITLTLCGPTVSLLTEVASVCSRGWWLCDRNCLYAHTMLCSTCRMVGGWNNCELCVKCLWLWQWFSRCSVSWRSPPDWGAVSRCCPEKRLLAEKRLPPHGNAHQFRGSGRRSTHRYNIRSAGRRSTERNVFFCPVAQVKRLRKLNGADKKKYPDVSII